MTPHPVKKLNALTSLRFFAAAMIVLGHCHGEFEKTNRIAEIFALNQAVSFFFVLSGFILAYVIIACHQDLIDTLQPAHVSDSINSIWLKKHEH